MTGQISPAPRVSVAIAAYNHAPFVRECIESVRAQTFTDWEIVVTDDGSSDGTAEILRELAATDPRVRFHGFAANQGACVAINDAITRARGEFIAILNSDDRFLPDKLERQVAFLDQHPEHAAVFALPRFIDEHGQTFRDETHKDYRIFQVENRSRTAWLRHFFLYGNCLCHPTVLIRCTCYETLGLYDPRLAQLPDFDLWVRLCMHYSLHILPESLLEFRLLGEQRNASAARPDVLAREPWERRHILRHFNHLDPADFDAVFPPESEAQPETPRWWRLARQALDIGRPAYRLLALELLHEGLGSVPVGQFGTPTYAEYHQLCADCDVFRQGNPS